MRPVEGYEVLAMIGFPELNWKYLPEIDVCVSLAGNAMSAYALGPFFMASASACGMICGATQHGSAPREASRSSVAADVDGVSSDSDDAVSSS